MRLLLVEDHPALRVTLAEALERAGYSVDPVGTAGAAEELAGLTLYDLIILDLGLPDADGASILQRLRRGGAVPIIVLTARDGVDDRVASLDAGADDYVVKPVDVQELTARCRAVLRRPGGRLGAVLRVGDLELDTVTREVRVGGGAVTLGRREIAALEKLLRRKGTVVPRRTLESAVYGIDDEIGDNALEAVVSRLRRALAAAGTSASIATVRGLGWMIVDDEQRR
jgi:DNA-binding response OmpR family regulator